MNTVFQENKRCNQKFQRVSAPNVSMGLVVLSTLGFFFTTLHEFYYESPIGFIRIFEFLGVGFWVLCFGLYGGRFFHVGTFVACMVVVLFAHSIPLFFSLMDDSSAVYWNTVLGMPISMCMVIVFLYLFSSREALLLRVLKYTLYVHLCFFYFQFLAFVSTGTIVNYLFFLGREQRMIGGDFTEETSLRCAGLTGEPAAFALTVVILITSICWGSRKVPWLLLGVVCCSVLLCFSSMGYFYLMTFFACFIVPRVKSVKTWIVGGLLGGIVSIGVVFLASEQIQKTYDKLISFQESGSYQYRIGSFLSYVVEDFSDALFGNGLGVLQIVSLRDGTYVGAGSSFSTVLLSCGLILGIFVFLSIWRALRQNKVPVLACVFTFTLFLGTNTPSQLIFWTWIFGMALVCRARVDGDTEMVKVNWRNG